MTQRPLSDEDLHAFIDGELPAKQAAEVAAVVENDADLARQVVAFRGDKARLAQLDANVLAQPLPAAWTRMIAQPLAPAPAIRWQRSALALAASIALLIMGALAFQQLAPQSNE